MRFVGPTYRRFESLEAREELLFLRKRVEQLFSILKTTKQKWGMLQGTRANGTEWMVRVVGATAGPPIVQIKVSHPASKQVFELSQYIFVLESGLLVSDQQPAWDIPREQGPIFLYLSQVAEDYFSSPGTLIEGEYKHLSGVFVFNSRGKWKGAKADIDVPNGCLLQGASKYQSGFPLYREGKVPFVEMPEMVDMDLAACMEAGIEARYGTANIGSMYTGLMRAAVQAKLGFGFPTKAPATAPMIEDLFPIGGIENAYKHCGLVRSSGYVYFSVYLSNTECRAVKMQASPDVENLRLRLAAGEFSGEDKKKVEVFVLSGLSATEEEFVLLSGEEITPDNSPAIDQPLAYGWHFNYGPVFKASIIRHGITEYTVGLGTKVKYTPYRTTIDFNVTDTTISATATTEKYEEWSGSQGPFLMVWTPTQRHDPLLSYLQPDWYPLGLGDKFSSPIYTFFTEDGEEKDVVISWDGTESATTHHTPPLADRTSACVAVGSETVTGSARIYVDIQIKNTEDALGELDYYYPNAHSVYETTFSYSSGGWTFFRQAFAPQEIGMQHPNCGDTVSLNLAYWREYKRTVSVVCTSFIRNYSTPIEDEEYIAGIAKALIIPRLNAEAVGILTRKAKHLDSGTELYRDNSNIQRYDGLKYNYYSDSTFTTVIDTIECDTGLAITTAGYGDSGGWTLEGAGPDGKVWTNRYNFTSNRSVSEEPEPRSYTADLYTSSGQITLAEGNAWYLYFNNALTEDFIGFSAQQGGSGVVKYPQHCIEPDEWLLSAPYADAEEILQYPSGSNLRVMRWVGWE